MTSLLLNKETLLHGNLRISPVLHRTLHRRNAWLYRPGRLLTRTSMTLKALHSVSTLLCNTREKLSFVSAFTCARLRMLFNSTRPCTFKLPDTALNMLTYTVHSCNDFIFVCIHRLVNSRWTTFYRNVIRTSY